jgi:vacuolar-type H+-ATPase subunit I/STV1
LSGSLPRTTAVAFLALATALSVNPSTAAAQGQTQKISKKLVERAEDMVKGLDKTRGQVVKTVGKYNDIFAKKSVKDRRKAYKSLTDEIKNTEKRVNEVRKQSNEMQKEAEKFFSQWFKGLAKIRDDQLRALSQTNMTENRDNYGRIIDSGLKAANLYGSFVTDLKNQLSYLNLDMSDNAMAKLAPTQAQTATKITELYQAVDELTRTTRGYIASMK